MIKNNNLDPLRYDYPAVTPLTNYLFFKLFFIPISWIHFYVANVGNILEGLIKIPLDNHTYRQAFQLSILGERELYALTWGRTVTAFLSVLIVFLTYLIGKKIYGWNVGIIASLLVAVNYRQVLNSHLGLPDIYNAFFLLLAFLFALKLLENPIRKNYILAGITAGLSFATKYQFFSFIPLALVMLYLVTKHKRLKIEMFLVPAIILFVFLILNPYMFLKIEETIKWTSSVAGKYRVGINQLDFYPLSYLYQIGIGKITSIFVLLGVLASLILNLRKTILLLSVIFGFFYITIFYTGGGFYTRNFVTIIPFLLIFAGASFQILLNIFKKSKYVGFVLVSILVIFISFENLKNSVVVPVEYTKPWNFKVLENWVSQNLPEGSKVSAHSSVPLPVKDVVRLPYDFDPAFSIEEFRKEGAEYAIANLDWATGDFYGWMTAYSLKYWDKPVDELNRSYGALTLKELSDFSIYSVLNPWQAPESNFIVAKVPQYKVLKKEIVKTYNKISDGWKSEPMEIQNWKGFDIDFDMTAKFEGVSKRDGYVYIKFFKSLEDAQKDVNEVAVRLSDRSKVHGEKINSSLVGVVPDGARYVVIGADVYMKDQNSLNIGELKLHKAEVEEDQDGLKIEKIELDENILFPNSHGYL